MCGKIRYNNNTPEPGVIYLFLFKLIITAKLTVAVINLCVYLYMNVCQYTSAVHMHAPKQTSTPTQSLRYTKQTTATKQNAHSGPAPFMNITKRPREHSMHE